MIKPREFWILADKYDIDCQPMQVSKSPYMDHWTNEESIHVIEKSAYDALAAKLAIAVSALEYVVFDEACADFTAAKALSEIAKIGGAE